MSTIPRDPNAPPSRGEDKTLFSKVILGMPSTLPGALVNYWARNGTTLSRRLKALFNTPAPAIADHSFAEWASYVHNELIATGELNEKDDRNQIALVSCKDVEGKMKEPEWVAIIGVTTQRSVV